MMLEDILKEFSHQEVTFQASKISAQPGETFRVSLTYYVTDFGQCMVYYIA